MHLMRWENTALRFWLTGALAIAAIYLLCLLLGRLRYLLRRLTLVRRLGRLCRAKKLHLKWVRPWFASLFWDHGEIDFVIDGHIHVAIFSTMLRHVSYQFTEDEVLLLQQRAVRIPQRRWGSASYLRKTGYLRRGDTISTVIGYVPHALDECEVPEGDARVLIVHPAPMAVNDCRNGQEKAVGDGDALSGGFRFNTMSQFFARLENYAATGDRTVWMPRSARKEWE